MTNKIAAHRYHSRADFLDDKSKLRKKAKVLVDFTNLALDGLEISHFEPNIAKIQGKSYRNILQLG